MTYLYAYLAICCICYYQTYGLILERFGTLDKAILQFLQEMKSDIPHNLSFNQWKVMLCIVLFFLSPFIIVGRILK